jgi:hypothetical protein
VRGDQHRPAGVAGEAEQELAHAVAGVRVETGGRLVEDQQRRLVDQRLGDLDPGLLTRGEVPHPALAEVAEVEQLDQLADPPPGAADRVHAGEDDQAFLDRQRAGQMDIAGGEIRPAQCLEAVGGQVGPEQADGALVGCDQTEEHVERGGLAGSVGPEETDHLTFANREADVVHGGNGTEALDQAARFKDCHAPMIAAANGART